MGRILVEYQPKISEKAKKDIDRNVTPSMISHDESSAQFEINQVLETLEEWSLDEEDTTDIKLIKKLIKEGVSFIEI